MHPSVQQAVIVPLSMSPGTTRCAIRAYSIEKKLVSCSSKSTWKLWLELCNAACQLIESSALITVKMMMMLLACQLVSGRFPRDLYRLEPSLFYKGLNIAINSCNSESRMVSLGAFKSFFRRKWSIGLCKGVSDSRFLFCISLFHRRPTGN